tara:strand:- start:1685 stop:4423 length:2739 start_codon:yes stop_codon:yes gene_type:complete
MGNTVRDQIIVTSGSLHFVQSGSGAITNDSSHPSGVRHILDFTINRFTSGSDLAPTGSEGAFFAFSGSHSGTGPFDSTTGLPAFGGGEPEDIFLGYYFTQSNATTLDTSSFSGVQLTDAFRTIFPTSSFANEIFDSHKIRIRVEHGDDSETIASASVTAINEHPLAGIFFTASSGVPILSGDGKFIIENLRQGQVNGPFSSSAFISASTVQSSSGAFGQILVEPVADPRSGSATLSFDPNDKGSFFISGSESSKLYLSGSGQLGLNTDDPAKDVDIRGDDIILQKKREQKGVRINEFGDLESFNFDADSSATGSEVVLKYQRGGSTTISVALAAEVVTTIPIRVGGGANASDTVALINGTFGGSVTAYLAAQKDDFVSIFNRTAQERGFFEQSNVGDVIGAVRYVVVSGSDNSVRDRSAGEAATIKAIVKSVDNSDGGVSARMTFNVAKETGDAAIQMVDMDPQNGVQISGSLVMANGSNIHLGTGIDGQDRLVNFTHGTMPFVIGVDDSRDRFAIHSANSFNTSGVNDLEMDGGGNVYFHTNKLALNDSVSTDYIQYADTGNGNGFVYKGNGKFHGSLTVTGAVTSSIITSSVVFSSGSNIFGDEQSDTHKFIGSISASGFISSSGHIESERIINPTIAPKTGTNNNATLEINASSVAYHSQIQFQKAGTTQWMIGSDAVSSAGSNDFRIIKSSAALNNFNGLFITASNYNVGVGTGTPDEKLTVEGAISASGEIYSDRIEILAQGSARVSSITNTTDYWGPNFQGPYHTANWNKNVTPESDGNIILERQKATTGFIVPFSCSLVGFDAIGSMNSGENTHFSMSLFTADALTGMDLNNSSTTASPFTASHATTGISQGNKGFNRHRMTGSCDIPLSPFSVVFPLVKVDAAGNDDGAMSLDMTYVIKIKRNK